MKCSECRFENKPDAERCTHCGVRLGPLGHTPATLNRYEQGNDQGHGETQASERQDSASGDAGASYCPLNIETDISPRTRVFLFSAVFYALLLAYASAALISPSNPYAQLATVFQGLWANFLLLVFFLVAASVCVYAAACYCCKRVLATPWGKPKMGKLLVQEGYVSKDELEEALEEQKLRIGEVLVLSGRPNPITTSNRITPVIQVASRGYL